MRARSPLVHSSSSVRWGVLLPCLGLLAVGCVSLDARRAIVESEDLVRDARAEDADRYAKYELSKAVLYLEEARLRNGYGEYRAASAYGARAVELARAAVQTSRQRKDLEQRRQGSEPADPKKRPPKPSSGNLIDIPGLSPTAPTAPPTTPPPTTPANPDEPAKKKLLPPGMGGGQ